MRGVAQSSCAMIFPAPLHVGGVANVCLLCGHTVFCVVAYGVEVGESGEEHACSACSGRLVRRDKTKLATFMVLLLVAGW